MYQTLAKGPRLDLGGDNISATARPNERRGRRRMKNRQFPETS